MFGKSGERASFAMVSLHGSIYILGGEGLNYDVRSSVWVSTDGGEEWEQTTPLATPRRYLTAVSTESLVC